MVVLGSKVGSSSRGATVSRDQSVSSRDSEVSVMDALVILSLTVHESFQVSGKLALEKSTRHGSRGSEVTDITLIIELSTCARSASDDSVCSLSVEALGVLLSSNVSDLLTQPALVVAVSSVVRGPLFEIGVLSIRSILTFALRFM